MPVITPGITPLDYMSVDDLNEHGAMEQERYIELHQSEYKPDPRYQALLDKLDWYYKCTPDEMSNHDALPYSRELHKWVRDCGYTNKEFSRAKRDYFNMNNSPDVPQQTESENDG